MIMVSSARRRIVALVAGTITVAGVVAAPAAFADRVPVGATGNTTFHLNGQAIKNLQGGGCGALAATATGNGTVTTGPTGKISFKLPITGLVVDPDSGAIRIQHTGSGVDLSNTCYDIRLTNFYIQNFGNAGQYMTFDVSAKYKDPDGTGRDTIFTLDLTNAAITMGGHGAVKVTGADVLLAPDGAADFNNLATGDPNSGPFMTGDQVGQAKTTIRIAYSVSTV